MMDGCNFCIDLLIGYPLADISIISGILTGNRPRGKIETSMLNPELLSWLESIGLIPIFCEFFLRAPFDSTPIHTDGRMESKGKLNWVYQQDKDNSIMNWYSVIHGATGTHGIGPIGTTHVIFDRADLELLYSSPIAGSPTLVRTGIPHDIVNGAIPRLMICLTMRDITTQKQVTWEKATKLFSKYGTT